MIPKEKKHTLDSDEEDDNPAPKKLDIRSVQGQEKPTIEYDGSVKIMPFNMDEENEEGHYDEDGNYVFDKEKNDIKDEWLDGFDWDSVKQKAGSKWNKMTDEDDNAEVVEADGVGACEQILKHLTDEKMTVNDVLKKMNTQKQLTPAEERKRRWEAKKSGVEYKNDFSELSNELTGAVDDLISLGHMDAYSMNRSQINELYEKLEIEKERIERAKRMKRQSEEEARNQAESSKLDTAEDLINDLMSDEEMDAEDSNSAKLNQIGEEDSELSSEISSST